MRNTVFRVLAGIIGTGFIFLALPVSSHSGDGFWPEWVHALSFFILGFVFLIYAITGQAWPRFYGEDISKKDNDLDDC